MNGSQTQRPLTVPCNDKYDIRPCKPSAVYVSTTSRAVCVPESVELWGSTFSRARNECTNSSGELLEIWDEEFQIEIENRVASIYGLNEELWLNLFFVEQYSSYRWLSDTSKWPRYYKTPLRFDGKNKCVTMNVRNGDWNVRYCQEKYSYACEQRIVPPSIPKGLKPTLKIFSHDPRHELFYRGEDIKAVCEGQVPPPLTLSFFVDSTFVPSNSSLVFITERPVYNYNFGACLSRLKAKLIVIDRAARNKTGVKIGCIVHEKRTTARHQGCDNCQAVWVRYGNRIGKPKLKALYHNTPNVLHMDRFFNVTCSACVGFHGNITWKLLPSLFMGQNLSLDQVEHGSLFSEEERLCGNYVITTLWLRVTRVLQFHKLQCISFDGGEQNRTNLKNSTTETFHIEDGPGTPNLTVNYHSYPARLVLGRRLFSECSACLGDAGKLSWRVVDKDDQDFEQDTMSGLHAEAPPEPNVTETAHCLRYANTSLTLVVNKSLDGARLVCRSWNKPYPFHVVFARSLPFQIPADQPGSSAGDMFPLILLILFITGCLYLFRSLCLGDSGNGNNRRAEKKPVKVEEKTATTNGRESSSSSATDFSRISTNNDHAAVHFSTDVDSGAISREFRHVVEYAVRANIPLAEAKWRLENIARGGRNRKVHRPLKSPHPHRAARGHPVQGVPRRSGPIDAENHRRSTGGGATNPENPDDHQEEDGGNKDDAEKEDEFEEAKKQSSSRRYYTGPLHSLRRSKRKSSDLDWGSLSLEKGKAPF